MRFLKFRLRKFDNLAFIFGCPRGGTTWLWSLLESHEDVLPFLIQNNKKDGKYSTSESGVYIRKPKQAKRKIEKFLSNNSGKLIIEKTPLHTFKHNQIRNDFPNAKFIVIFRNPIAVVNSMTKSQMIAFTNYDIEKSIEETKRYYLELLKIIRNNDTYILTYEYLFSDTKKQFIDLLNYLNLKRNNLDEIIFDNKNKSKVMVKGAFRKAIPNSYQNDLNKNELEYIREKLKSEINIFNNIYRENISSK